MKDQTFEKQDWSDLVNSYLHQSLIWDLGKRKNDTITHLNKNPEE